MGGKKSKAPAPDPQIGEAAKMQAAIAAEWLDFSKEQFAIGNERQKGIDALTQRVTEQQLATQDRANQWAQEDRDRYKTVFQPLEDKYVQDANNWDSQDRQAQVAAEASADVLNSASQQRAASKRSMAAMGVNPNSGRFAGIDRASELQTGLAAAGARNTARNQVRQQGMAMRADALNIGKGLPAQAAAGAGLGLTAGSSALNGNLAANASWGQNNSIMGQGFQGAAAGYGQQANILNQQYQGQLSAWSTQQQANAAGTAGLWGGLGTAAGLGMMAFSSKELKEDKTPVEGALDAVNSMPVEEWTYKQGVADEGRHIGPYAEDFQAATGKGDGKTINLMDAVGVNMKATQELSQKVDQVADAVSQLAGAGIRKPARRAKA
jgi:hypothetical protein